MNTFSTKGIKVNIYIFLLKDRQKQVKRLNCLNKILILYTEEQSKAKAANEAKEPVEQLIFPM